MSVFNAIANILYKISCDPDVIVYSFGWFTSDVPSIFFSALMLLFSMEIYSRMQRKLTKMVGIGFTTNWLHTVTFKMRRSYATQFSADPSNL